MASRIFCTLSSVAGLVFGRFLESEGTAIMTTGRNLVIFAILIFGLSFWFRLYCVRLRKKDNFRVVFFLYLSILFIISFYLYFLRIYLVSRFGLIVPDLFPFSSVLICSVGAGQPLDLPGPSGPSHSGPGSFDWHSFDEKVLLEPMPEESGSSVNGPSNTGEANSSETSWDPDRDPEEVQRKGEELHLLVRDQFRHYCERGRPRWRLSRSEDEIRELYDELTRDIISGLELKPRVSEHQMWLDGLRQAPTSLHKLFRDYK